MNSRLAYLAILMAIGGCSESPLSSKARIESSPANINRVTQPRWLPIGQAIPVGQVVNGAPEPYSVARYGALPAGPTPENRAGDPSWQPPAAHKRGPERTLAVERTTLPSGPPTINATSFHEGRGWNINLGRGIYARVDMQRDFTIKVGDKWETVYAPTHYPAGGSCLEATAMHYRTSTNPSGPTSNFLGFWDWCERTDGGYWGYAADMDAAGFRSKYVRSMMHTDGSGTSEEGAYFQIYADNASLPAGSYDCWRGLLFNFNTGGWELVITRCGPNPTHVYYPSNFGWSMWEDYNVTAYGCSDYDHPGISAENVMYMTSGGVFSTVADPGVKSTLLFPSSGGYCWPGGAYVFDEHLTDMWHGHTYADRQ